MGSARVLGVTAAQLSERTRLVATTAADPRRLFAFTTDGARGFGAGNFKALFEAIEREQARRGNF